MGVRPLHACEQHWLLRRACLFKEAGRYGHGLLAAGSASLTRAYAGVSVVGG